MRVHFSLFLFVQMRRYYNYICYIYFLFSIFPAKKGKKIWIVHCVRAERMELSGTHVCVCVKVKSKSSKIFNLKIT
jgi:hypothetical protein